MASEQSEISRLENAQSLGLEFLRTIIVLNGGAILALLAFISNSSPTAAVQLDLTNLKYSMSAFLVGISSVLIGVIFSYSFTAVAPETQYSRFWNSHIVKLNTILAIVSLIAFLAGVAILISGATATP